MELARSEYIAATSEAESAIAANDVVESNRLFVSLRFGKIELWKSEMNQCVRCERDLYYYYSDSEMEEREKKKKKCAFKSVLD